MLAFERSISKQMRDIGQKSVNFKIIGVESLLKDNVNSCCYVSARWRTELYRIPRHRTIILHFKERLTSPEQLLKEFADEITQITGIPCFYHLRKAEPNTSRWVYIIAFTKVGRGPSSTEIDFFRICKENLHQLKTKCLEISPLYENYTTMMENSDTTEDVPKLENRFSALDVEDITEYSDDYFLSHIYDDDHDSVIEATEGLDQASPDYEPGNSSAEAFVRVKSSAKERQPGPKYSTPCQYEFSCLKGRHCDYKHTQEQVDFFKANDGKGRMGYKSKPCRYHYANRSCKNGPKNKTPNCVYYHSEEEARCYVCKTNNLKYIGHASHDDCEAHLTLV